MSKKRNESRNERGLLKTRIKVETPLIETRQISPQSWQMILKRNWLIVLIIGVATLGVLGSGLSYLEQDARRQMQNGQLKADNQEQSSLLNRVNPFLPAPLPNPTPQLSREYLYAGSRLLSVEDANANAAPPADLAIWRPSSGQWWVMGGTGSQQVNFTWGMTGDVPVPGDYDGDGKTDFSIFRPSSNTWWVMKSSDNTYYSNTFGAGGDKVAQADYDGDGKTDCAVFRPADTNWYILQSGSGQSAQGQFGLSSDTPAPADYDGDGRADLAVWRDSTAVFYSANSSNGQVLAAALGSSSSEPVSADYDGDGKADYAVRNGTNWLIKNSANGQTQIIAWQSGSDKAVQNDYDGDGKVDVAVWRSSNGNWYIRQSARIGQANELRQVQWGTAGDIPVPAFYRRQP
jgi:hypothetical protein